MERFHIDLKYEYCPNGNYWQEISGIFDKSIYLFCDCPKCKGQVYMLKPFNMTKKVDKEIIARARKQNKLDNIKNKITMDNMGRVEKIL
jgi:hypothetical protein